MNNKIELAYILSDLIKLEDMGFCWFIGSTRLSKCVCRIFTKTQKSWALSEEKLICITEYGDTFEEAINRALHKFYSRMKQ